MRADPGAHDDDAATKDAEAIAVAAAAAAVVVGDILSRHEGVEAIPLAPHRCAATVEGRREGLVIDDDDGGGVGGRDGDGDGDGVRGGFWTARDSDRVFLGGVGEGAGGGCPPPPRHEVYLGLRFYEEDPLPFVRRACAEYGKAFADHEFPVFPGASVLVGGERLRPGILSPSNRDDFSSCGGKRAGRVGHFASRARDDGWEWRRVSSMNDAEGTGGGYEIFSSAAGSIGPGNVIQGRVGNCGFCSGLASVAAARPVVVRNAFGPYSEECLRSCGAYSVRLFPRGRRRFLLLDDYLLCEGGGSDASPSLRSSRERDLWIRLLEKAYVKVQGSYASLDGYYKLNSLYRHPARALQLLTGAPAALEFYLGGCDDGNDRDVVPVGEDDAYGTLLDTQGVCARVAHCRRTVDGLRSNHGYSLLWIGEAGAHRLVCLRNPHGHGPYTGPDWGVGSSPWREEWGAVRRMLEENACFIRCNSTDRVTWRGSSDSNDQIIARDDGIFFMGFATFYRFFPIVTLVGPLTSCCDVRISRTDVPDCVHSVKGNISCVKEILGIIRSGLL
jgi:hypothetical protein